MTSEIDSESSMDRLEEELQKLREGFVDRLPGRLENLTEEWHRLLAQGWNRESARAVHRSVHGLVGTSGSLGLSGVAKTARRLERRLAAMLEGSDSPSSAQRDEVFSWFERIGEAIDEWEGGVAYDSLNSIPLLSADRDDRRNLIVVIEQDPLFAQEMSMQLDHFGFELLLLKSVEDVTVNFVGRRVVAVIMDVSSPSGDLVGSMEAGIIRKRLGADMPVVFVSNRSDIAARLEAVRAGCSGYFVKPVDFSGVLEMLDRLTRREPEPCRILIVDDDPDAAEFHSLSLRAAGFETVTVTDPLSVISRLVDIQPDLILMDVYMPGCSGVELAAVIRQEEAFVGISIVFLSRESDRMLQLAALGQGGDDFFTKPVEPSQLVAAITARAQRGRTLRLFMERDGLTGLLSHSRIMEQIEVVVRRSHRLEGKFSVAMIDIDGFKEVNDKWGHLAGDQVLKALAYLLRQRMRLSDVLGRFGGDEYVVILPDTGGAAAVEILEKIRERFSSIEHDTGRGSFSVTLSCGVAEYEIGASSHSLIAAADDALYRAKRSGRDRIVLAREEV